MCTPESGSARRSTCSEHLLRVGDGASVLVCLLLAASLMLIVSCRGERAAEREGSQVARLRALEEYRVLQAEVAVASTESLYLVLDFAHARMDLRMRGTRVWSYPLRARNGEKAVEAFLRRFRGDEGRVVGVVHWKHRFRGQEKIPPQVLGVVGTSLGVSPEALQRVVPQRVLLSFGDRTYVDIHTEVTGRVGSRTRDVLAGWKKAMGLLAGGACVDLSVEGLEALTLHDAVRRGTPVLVVPPLLAQTALPGAGRAGREVGTWAGRER